ncbi:MAG: transglycosylase SLT domain-containing protein [Hyphomicrobiales bacterium]|nr:transglycosylase SLT domain-containing protein [Hyphomicrobiales bacterium]
MKHRIVLSIIIGVLGLLTKAEAHSWHHHHVVRHAPASYRAMAIREAHAGRVPASLVLAVINVESSFNPHVIHAGNFGLMQIRPKTARGLGYRGPARGLLNPAVNVRYGVKYLALAWHRAGGNVCRALMGYQSGVYARHMSRANVRYCHKARLYMAHS